MGATVSARSHVCLTAIDRAVITSSHEAGWTSLLVDHHSVRPDEQLVEIPPTPDQTIVVGVRGAQELEILRSGRTSREVYGAGTVGSTSCGQSQRLRRRRALGMDFYEKINIYVPATTVAGVCEFLGRPVPTPGRPLVSAATHDQTMANLAQALVRAVRQGLPDLYAESAAHWLTTHLLCSDVESRRSSERDDDLSPATRARLDGVLELMRTCYAEPLSMDRLAEEAQVSKYHLSRLFRQVTGCAPYAYLLDVRFAAAAQLLVDTDLTVAQVARRCGFAGAAHFSAAFGRRHGMSPQAYRRRTSSSTTRASLIDRHRAQ